MSEPDSKPAAGKMNLDTLFLLGMIAGWILLQTVVFPKMGIST